MVDTETRTSVAPSLGEAVLTMHRALCARVTAWGELARELGSCSARVRRESLQRLDEDLRRHVLPYLQLEEHLLDRADPLLMLEHGAIRRAARRVHHIATAGELHPYLAQSTVAALYDLLEDHLRHEREVYLPAVAGR